MEENHYQTSFQFQSFHLEMIKYSQLILAESLLFNQVIELSQN